MKNKVLLYHAFCVVLFILGCGFFYIMDGGTNANGELEQTTNVDIDVIPDPMVAESSVENKSKMELFEEYETAQKRKEASLAAEQEFNSMSFFTGHSTSSVDSDEKKNVSAMSEEEQIEELNKIGKDKGMGVGQTNAKHSSYTGDNAEKNVSAEEKENAPKESIEEKIARQKKEIMRQKHKKIAEATGIDLSEEDEVPAQEPVASVSAPTEAVKTKSKGFRTMGAGGAVSDNSSIRAVIHGEQKNITTASQVKLRILDNISLESVKIPKNTMVYAKASFSNNRMHLNIESITYNDNVYPFNAQDIRFRRI